MQALQQAVKLVALGVGEMPAPRDFPVEGELLVPGRDLRGQRGQGGGQLVEQGQVGADQPFDGLGRQVRGRVAGIVGDHFQGVRQLVAAGCGGGS